MKHIALTQGKFALVSDADFTKLVSMKWAYGNHGYAVCNTYIQGSGRLNEKNKTILMHRFLLNAPSGSEVDHINGDKLDNQRSNLRIVTSSQNKYNLTKYKNNTSGYKGVYFDRFSGRWKAQIGYDGKHHSLGRFSSPEEASVAYIKAEHLYHRGYARG